MLHDRAHSNCPESPKATIPWHGNPHFLGASCCSCMQATTLLMFVLGCFWTIDTAPCHLRCIVQQMKSGSDLFGYLAGKVESWKQLKTSNISPKLRTFKGHSVHWLVHKLIHSYSKRTASWIFSGGSWWKSMISCQLDPKLHGGDCKGSVPNMPFVFSGILASCSKARMYTT